MAVGQTLPREERLRTTAGLRGTPALGLSAWRGKSGRRYVVGIHQIGGIDPDDIGEAVVIAVRRDAPGYSAGIAQAVRVEACAEASAVRALLAGLPKACTELHIHRLCEGDAERAAAVSDLTWA
ncbi:hypothetical protein [Methylobacterium sp. CM6246]